MAQASGNSFRRFWGYLVLSITPLVIICATTAYLLRDRPFYSIFGISVPEQEREWQGRWKAPESELYVPETGNVVYMARREGIKFTFSFPLQAIEQDEIVIGFAYWAKHIAVQAQPHLVDGKWHATVDNIDLTRQD